MKHVPFEVVDGAPYRDWWNERFAPERDPFAGMRFYQRGKATVWVGTADIDGLETTIMDAVGLHLVRINRPIWKPTTAAVIAFGADATRNFIDLDKGEMFAFLAGETLELDAADPRRAHLSRGFAAARSCGVPLGCGEWHDSGAFGSLMPKRLRSLQLDH